MKTWMPAVFCEHANESPRGGVCLCSPQCSCREPREFNGVTLNGMCPELVRHNWCPSFYLDHDICTACGIARTPHVEFETCSVATPALYESRRHVIARQKSKRSENQVSAPGRRAVTLKRRCVVVTQNTPSNFIDAVDAPGLSIVTPTRRAISLTPLT